MVSSRLTKKPITMSGLFRILERIGMGFPKARTGLNDKVRFEEKISFILKSEDGTIKEKQ